MIKSLFETNHEKAAFFFSREENNIE